MHESPESGGVAGAVAAGESVGGNGMGCALPAADTGAERSLRVEAPGVAARVPAVGRRAAGAGAAWDATADSLAAGAVTGDCVAAAVPDAVDEAATAASDDAAVGGGAPVGGGVSATVDAGCCAAGADCTGGDTMIGADVAGAERRGVDWS